MMLSTPSKTNQTTPLSKEFAVNLPQMLYNLISPNLGACIWGRFTGKSVGPGGFFTINNIYKMPRSNGFLQGTTYAQLHTKLLPALKEGWDRYGMIENKHYWVGKMPPAKLKIPTSLREPDDAKHFIKWHNGTGIYLVSQDRGSTINGVRTQWGFCDEAKLLNKEKFDTETVPTMAGGAELWGEKAPVHLAEYLSLLFCTDMPTRSKERWVLDFEKEVNPKRVELVLQTQLHIFKLEQQLKSEPSEAIQKHIAAEIAEYKLYLNDLRKKTVYFSLASAIDNVGFVGMDAIKNQRRVLTDTRYRVQILNERIIKHEQGFYASVDPDRNGYADMLNYSYYDTLDYSISNPNVRDCRWDYDINPNEPLEIAMDHNNAINCIVTAQSGNGEDRMLSSKWVANPLMQADCIKKWHEYYKYHPVKDVYYYHDATSIGGNSRSDISIADEVIKQLNNLGWNVVPKFIGQIGTHNSRYYFWGVFGAGDDPRLPKFSYNRANCQDWEASALQAGVIKIGDKVKKDKSSEKPGSGVEPQEATHLSEAGDVLFWGKYREVFDQNDDYIGIIKS